jgi:hypothetical protein
VLERLKQLGTGGKATLALVISIVSLAGAGVSLLFTLDPALKPDPSDRLSATVTVQATERGVTLGSFMDRTNRRMPGADDTDRSTPGEMLYVRVGVAGRKHQPIELRATYYDARTQRLIPGSEDFAAVFSNLKVDTPDDKWVEPIFIFNPYAKPVFLRLGIYSDDVLLAFTDTRPLAARG